MIFGKQYYYCANCGTRLYDSTLTMKHVMSMLCSKECRDEYELKYTRMVLGKSADEYTE